MDFLTSTLSEQFTNEDLLSGFPFLQLFSFLRPHSIDLTWYSTEAAFECDDIKIKIFQDIETALNKLSINYEKNVLNSIQNGKLEDALALLEKIKENFGENPIAAQFDSFEFNEIDYGFSEPSFKALMRWALTFIRHNLKEVLSKETLLELKGIIYELRSSIKTVPISSLSLLCGGRLYLIIALHCTCSPIDFSFQSFIDPIENHGVFLDILLEQQVLDINPSMKASLEEMLTDRAPFYESLHLKILEALINLSYSKISKSSLSNEKRYSIASFFKSDDLVDRVNSLLSNQNKIDSIEDMTDCMVFNTLLRINSSNYSGHTLSSLIKQCKSQSIIPPFWLPIEAQGNEYSFKSCVKWYTYYFCSKIGTVRVPKGRLHSVKVENQPQQKLSPDIESEVHEINSESETVHNSDSSTNLPLTDPTDQIVSIEPINQNLIEKNEINQPVSPQKNRHSISNRITFDSDIGPLFRSTPTQMFKKLLSSRPQTRNDAKRPQNRPSPLKNVSSRIIMDQSKWPDMNSSTLNEEIKHKLSNFGTLTPSSNKKSFEDEELSNQNSHFLIHQESIIPQYLMDLSNHMNHSQSDEILLIQEAHENDEIPIESVMEIKDNHEAGDNFKIKFEEEIEIVDGKENVKEIDNHIHIKQEDMNFKSNDNEIIIEELTENNTDKEKEKEEEIRIEVISKIEEVVEKEEPWKTEIEEFDEIEKHNQKENVEQEMDLNQELNEQTLKENSSLDSLLGANLNLTGFEESDSNESRATSPHDDTEWNQNDEENLIQSRKIWETLITFSDDEEDTHIAPSDLIESDSSVALAAEPAKTLFYEIQLDDGPKTNRRPIITPKKRQPSQSEDSKDELRNNWIKVQEQKHKLEEEKAKKKTVHHTHSPVKLFHSPIKSQSNKSLVKNALLHVCLAGPLSETLKADVLADLEESTASHFIILFKGQKNNLFRGLYSYDTELDQVLKVYSGTQGPDELVASQVIEFYKYDSGSKSFKTIETKSFGRSVCACAINFDTVKMGKKTVKEIRESNNLNRELK